MHKTLVDYLKEAGLQIQEGGTIVMPDWVRRVKVDVGLSYSAPNSIKWIREDPNLMVFGFEPLPESCEELRRELSKHHDSEVLARQLIVLPVALGVKAGMAQLHVTAETASSSLLPPKEIEQVETVTVPVFPLSDLMRSIPLGMIERVDYLKLDCQGLDLEILKATGPDWLRRIAIVTAEAEDEQYVGSSNGLRALIEFMTAIGFIHLNPRSSLRVSVGKLLSKSSIVRALRIRFPVRRSREADSANISIQVEDPTFINRAFLREVLDGEITGFQKG